MKNVLIGLVCGVVAGMVSLVSAADVSPTAGAQTAGAALVNQKDYPAARAIFETAIKDNPTATVGELARLQMWVGWTYKFERNLSEASAEFAKVITSYPTVDDYLLHGAQYMVGQCAMGQKKYDEAQTAFEKALKDYPKVKETVSAQTQYFLALSLTKQGKSAEANAAYMTCVSDYFRALGAADENSVVWTAFKGIDSRLIAKDTYKTFLDDARKSSDPEQVQRDAAFLGLMKSESGKL